MPISYLPQAAMAANLPREIRPQIASSCAQPAAGDGWLHEPKHDGWRLIAIVDGSGAVKLLSRQGLDHTRLFGTSFRELAATRRAMVLVGELAVPDERGVTAAHAAPAPGLAGHAQR
jgi:bifunctional non-homologous end joining protein LigD